MFIPYLKAGNYYGIEPNKWLVEEGIANEVGKDMVNIKRPSFFHTEDFELSVFNEKFDFMVAQSIFSHTSEEQVDKCMKEVKPVLGEEGFFLTTFVLGEENYTGKEWVYPGSVTFRHEYILEMIRRNGLDAIRTKWQHPNKQTWYVIFHPENREEALKRVRGLFDTNRVKKKKSPNKWSRQWIIHKTFAGRVYRKLITVLGLVR